MPILPFFERILIFGSDDIIEVRRGETDWENREKAIQRRQFLQEHPEARIRINTEPLRNILPYKYFLCHPKCSIARDEAVLGSDIDHGRVIVDQKPSLEEEIAFVEELKRQGFSIFHPREAQEAKERYDQLSEAAYGTAEHSQVIHEYVITGGQQITFHYAAGGVESPYYIYSSGFSIE